MGLIFAGCLYESALAVKINKLGNRCESGWCSIYVALSSITLVNLYVQKYYI